MSAAADDARGRGKLLHGQKEWILEGELDRITSLVLNFRDPEVALTILPLFVTPKFALLGCYVPTIPRPTSLIAGKILLCRLGKDRTTLQARDFPDWAEPFLQSLLSSLSPRKDLIPCD